MNIQQKIKRWLWWSVEDKPRKKFYSKAFLAVLPEVTKAYFDVAKFNLETYGIEEKNNIRSIVRIASDIAMCASCEYAGLLHLPTEEELQEMEQNVE
jgi:hypothetical protein